MHCVPLRPALSGLAGHTASFHNDHDQSGRVLASNSSTSNNINNSNSKNYDSSKNNSNSNSSKSSNKRFRARTSVSS